MLKSEPYNVKAVWGIQRERERESYLQNVISDLYKPKMLYYLDYI